MHNESSPTSGVKLANRLSLALVEQQASTAPPTVGSEAVVDELASKEQLTARSANTVILWPRDGSTTSCCWPIVTKERRCRQLTPIGFRLAHI